MTDQIAKNLSTQLNLNTGTISARSSNGSIQYVDQTTGKTLNLDAASTMLSQNPTVYAGNIGSDAYNHALGIFGDANVPKQMTETLSAIAAYYSSQTGISVYELFNNGAFEETFLTAINSLRDPSSQIGQFTINQQPNWANNILLGPSVIAALTPRVLQ